MHVFSKHSKPLVFDRVLTQFFAVMFLWAIVEGMTTFYLPIFIEEKLADLLLVGIFLGLGSVSSTVTDLVFALFADLSDFRKFLYLGFGMYLAMIPLLLWGSGPLIMLLLVVLWGAQFEMFYRQGSALFLARHSPPGGLAKTSSFNIVTKYVGFFIGPILADYLRIGSGAYVVFGMAILLLANLFFTYIWFTRRSRVHTANIHHARILSEVRIIKKHFRRVLPHLILGFGTAGFETIFLVFGPIEFDRTTDISGLIFSAGLVVNVVIPPLAVPLMKMWDPKRWILLIGLLTFVSSLMLALSPGIAMLVILVLFGLSLSSLLYAIKEALFLELVSEIKVNEEDEVVSVNGLGPNISYAIVAMVGGVAMATIGFYAAMIVGAMVMVLSVIAFAILYNRDTREPAPKMHN